MDRRVAHYKAKLHRGKIGGKAARGPEAPPEEVVTPPSPPLVTTFELPSGTIVRRKRFAMQPMPPEEAATHMELLGHEFFLFLNSTTGQFNVLYRRRDGDYGLIEPEPE
ncbi:MAG: sigma 54 modulation/S30EA ribosomal C-terminal domain-containing protein [Chloroflexi bacterium]|nr:sigma 54 modulation/S30EA ribosomal C-terminal domain-containing protein [Chloroflexota bacterium]